MATKAHRLLTGSDLHEPKGVETASVGQVYVADGTGSGSWVSLDIGVSFSTGDVKLTYKQAADTGWIMMDDNTSIGDTGSGATLTGSLYHNLFNILWSLPVTYIVSPSKGGSAAADWAAGKKIFMPRVLGRALALGGAGSGLTSRNTGNYDGGEKITLATGNLPAYTPAGSIHITDPGHQHDLPTPNALIGGNGQSGGEPNRLAIIGASQTIGAFTGISATFSGTPQGGASTPFSVVQPTAFLNAMIKV